MYRWGERASNTSAALATNLVGNKRSVSWPYHCPLCSGMCVRQWRWYLVGCWHPPGCPVLLHPCRQTWHMQRHQGCNEEKLILNSLIEAIFSTVVNARISSNDLDMEKEQWTISISRVVNIHLITGNCKILSANSRWKRKKRELWANRLPLCLAVVVLGMWMGSFRAPRRWTVRSWITSRMCLIQSCLFSMLEAWGRTRQRGQTGSDGKHFQDQGLKSRAATPEPPTQDRAFNPTWVIWFAILHSRHASANGPIVKWRQQTPP